MNELLTRTICIKLDVARSEVVLAQTQRRFNEASSWVASTCWEERITNTNTAHHRVYAETRTCFGLGAQLAICARAKAMEAIKAVKTQDAQRMARWRKANAQRRKKGKKELPQPEPGSCPQFGLRSSIRYDARKKGARYVGRRAALQRVGTRSAKRLLKQMRGRERRWMRNVNHTISKTLVEKSVVSHKALALEDLTGIREEVTVRSEQRYEQHCLAFYQLRQFLTYKAALAGVPVFLVDPAYTSQTCSRCGYCDPANRLSQSSFKCQRCGFCCHADFNAAMTIAQAGHQAAYGSGGTSPATSPSLLRDVGT